MKITYDTVADAISCPDLTPEQTQQLQSQLSSALYRDEPVQTVVRDLLATIRSATSGGTTPGDDTSGR